MCYNLKCSGWKLLNFWCLSCSSLFVGFIQPPDSLPISPQAREKYRATFSAPPFFFLRRLWSLRMIVTSYNHPTEDISHRLYMFSYMFWCFFFLKIIFLHTPPEESQKWHCTGTKFYQSFRMVKLLSTLKDATFEVTINQ